MTIAARTTGTVVPLVRPAHRHPALPSATRSARLHAWSESWADEPLPHLPDLPPDLAAALPEAIGQPGATWLPAIPARSWRRSRPWRRAAASICRTGLRWNSISR